MIPVPLPNVQKSSKPLWPTPSSTQRRLGAGTAWNEGSVASATGTTASTAPPMKNDGLSGRSAGAALGSAPSRTPEASDT